MWSGSSGTGRPPCPAGGAGAAEPPPAAALPEVPVLSGSLEAAEQIPRRVPVPVLRPALDRCRPTGVRLDETARVVVMADQGGVGDALVSQLGKLGVAVLAVADAPDAETLGQRLAEFSAEDPVTGVYWLPALDAEGPVGGAGPRRLARGPADPGRAAVHGHAGASPRARRSWSRPPGWAGSTATTRPGRSTRSAERVTGFAKAYAPGGRRRARQGGRPGAEPQDRGVGRAADRRDPA